GNERRYFVGDRGDGGAGCGPCGAGTRGCDDGEPYGLPLEFNLGRQVLGVLVAHPPVVELRCQYQAVARLRVAVRGPLDAREDDPLAVLVQLIPPYDADVRGLGAGLGPLIVQDGGPQGNEVRVQVPPATVVTARVDTLRLVEEDLIAA